jgi:drug/metabolite transporter (DMT)-like permease
LFSCHILVIDHFSPMVDGVKLSCLQFLVSGVLSGVVMFVTEMPSLQNIWAAIVPILYAGVLSCGVAYTLQIVGQKNYNPTVATLLMSLESVFSALTGWLILHQSLSGREFFGCVLIFAAVILAQLPERTKK